MTVNSAPRNQALCYERSIRGLKDQAGSGTHLFHKGGFVACHSAAPPPIEEYAAWLATLPVSPNVQRSMDAKKLRRIVIMRRQGSTQSECGQAIGHTQASVNRWIGRLPVELRP